jgi:hypothetical protein
MSNPYREPSKDASYKISIHLVKRFQRKSFLRNQPIRKKNCLWPPCLLTDQIKMSNFLFVVAMFVNGLGGNKQSL